MTFDFTPELDSIVEQARLIAATEVSPAATSIDATGSIPRAVQAAVAAVVDVERSPLAAVLAIEELAAASGSAAAAAVLGSGPDEGLAGLRGVRPVAEPNDWQTLGMAAVCLGLGRAALSEALARLRQRGDRPSGTPEQAPHWVLADAATELEGARLVVRATAGGNGPGAAASLVLAGTAANRAVEAAVRIVGADGFRSGSMLERVGRDVRAASLVLGTEDDARRRAADELLG